MSEKTIERYLIKRCRERGWWPLKFSSTSEAGMPDRLILVPGGVSVWVELKAPGKEPGYLQRFQLARLEGFGFAAFTADSREAVDRIISEIEDPPLQKIVKMICVEGKRYVQHNGQWKEETSNEV